MIANNGYNKQYLRCGYINLLSPKQIYRKVALNIPNIPQSETITNNPITP